VLRPENVVAPLPADTVQAAVSALAQRLIDGGAVADPEKLARLFSESRIRDTDMAQEMVEFTRNQILSQAGTAMLAQANQSSASVLSLLQG